MKGGNAAGYSIFELLIVLAVSMALLVGAGFFISKKQANTEFVQAIRSVQGDMQQIMNEVASGYYPNLSGVGCSVAGGAIPGGVITLTSTGTDTQGSNQDCVFMGRALQFNTDDPDNDAYNIFTVVGVNNQTSILNANPRVIARGSAELASVPDEFETKKLRSNLKISKMFYGGTANTISAFAFLTNLSTSGVGDGSQIVNMMRIGPPAAMPVTTPISTPVAVDFINANLRTNTTTATIYMCFDSASTRQSGLVRVGEAYRYNAVELRIYANPGCV
jgi:hypothetical protein